MINHNIDLAAENNMRRSEEWINTSVWCVVMCMIPRREILIMG
jgi:hypothetical protein